MSQNPEIQDSATLRELDRTINLVEMGESNSSQRVRPRSLQFITTQYFGSSSI
jgi:hypothetical protein